VGHTQGSQVIFQAVTDLHRGLQGLIQLKRMQREMMMTGVLEQIFMKHG
jgi:hypothetical protein